MDRRAFLRAVINHLIALLVLFTAAHYWVTGNLLQMIVLLCLILLAAVAWLVLVGVFIVRTIIFKRWDFLILVLLLIEIPLLRWALVHTYSPRYQERAFTSTSSSKPGFVADTLLVGVALRGDEEPLDVRKGDRIHILSVADSISYALWPGSIHDLRFAKRFYGVTSVTYANRGVKPWGKKPHEPPDPDVWRSIEAPAYWPMVAIKTKVPSMHMVGKTLELVSGMSRWYPVEEDTTYTVIVSGKLVFGVNLQERLETKYLRQSPNKGEWRIRYIHEHPAR